MRYFSRIHLIQLRTFVFSLYVSDLHYASKVLNPNMFGDDTNLFFSYSDINVVIEKMNKELTNVSNSFNANKLSLNVKKAKYYFFRKSSKKIIFRCGFEILIAMGCLLSMNFD